VALQSFRRRPRLGWRETKHQAAATHCATATMGEAATCGAGSGGGDLQAASLWGVSAQLVDPIKEWASEGLSLSRGALHYSSYKP